MLNNSFDKTHTSAIKLKKGKATFADNVLTLAGGTTIALGVTILASPITSRLFAPEAFGLAALFMSGAAFMGLLACMRYEMAIVLPKNDEEAASLFILCCVILAATTTFTFILSLILGQRVLVYLDAVELKPYLWLFPPYVFLIGSRLPFTHWFMRHKRFKISAANRVLISLYCRGDRRIGRLYNGRKSCCC
jgi:O-antigen/teichoic acid export membrane protein